MKVYSENGYLNIRDILNEGYPFNFIVGGRGTGKTYSSLKTLYEDKKKFMLMRRTQTEADLISKPEFSVFKPLNNDYNWDVRAERISKYNSAFYEMHGDLKEQIGYTCALSTIANMRGFDASDVEVLIYDEFIPEKHVRLLKDEASALFNAYETMNRNREFTGKPPIQMVCLANSNEIANPLFAELKLIRIADKMQTSGQMRYTDDSRGIQLLMLNRSPISKKKENTALYRLTKDSEYSNMAIGNTFHVDREHICSHPLNEFSPVCKIGELCIYKHKSERLLYATTHESGVFNKQYGTTSSDKSYYRMIYKSHWHMYISGRMDFEDLVSEKIFQTYWDT